MRLFSSPVEKRFAGGVVFFGHFGAATNESTSRTGLFAATYASSLPKKVWVPICP
jgi:hypothetical protein